MARSSGGIGHEPTSQKNISTCSHPFTYTVAHGTTHSFPIISPSHPSFLILSLLHTHPSVVTSTSSLTGQRGELSQPQPPTRAGLQFRWHGVRGHQPHPRTPSFASTRTRLASSLAAAPANRREQQKARLATSVPAASGGRFRWTSRRWAGTLWTTTLR